MPDSGVGFRKNPKIWERGVLFYVHSLKPEIDLNWLHVRLIAHLQLDYRNFMQFNKKIWCTGHLINNK